MKSDPCEPCPIINKPCDARQVDCPNARMPMKRHKAAVFALWKYGQTSEGASAEIVFNALDPHQKACCRIAVGDILAAPDEDVPEICFGNIKVESCFCPAGSLCEFFKIENESCLYGDI